MIPEDEEIREAIEFHEGVVFSNLQTHLKTLVNLAQAYLKASKEFPPEKKYKPVDEEMAMTMPGLAIKHAQENFRVEAFNQARELCLLACVKGRMSEREILEIINSDNYEWRVLYGEKELAHEIWKEV